MAGDHFQRQVGHTIAPCGRAYRQPVRRRQWDDNFYDSGVAVPHRPALEEVLHEDIYDALRQTPLVPPSLVNHVITPPQAQVEYSNHSKRCEDGRTATTSSR